MRKVGLLGVVVCAIAFAALPSAAGAQTFCNGPFTGTTDNVFVFPNATCILTGATVNGNVIVLRGGALVVGNGTKISLNVIATSPRYIQFVNGLDCIPGFGCSGPPGITVGQNVIVTGTTGLPAGPSPDSNTICNADIGQNVKLLQNKTPFEVGDVGDVLEGCFSPVLIHGNAIAIQNTGSLNPAPFFFLPPPNFTPVPFPFPGPFSVIFGYSVIDQNLICVANNPPANGTFATAMAKIGECSL